MPPYVLLSLILMFLPSLALAQSLVLVDQAGSPVPDAAVELTGPEVESVQWGASAYLMDQKDFQFVPRVLVVPKGASVSFPNNDESRHHVYSFSNTKTFELQLYAGNQADPVTFPTAGIVAVGCNIHDRMSAHIVVTDADWAGVSNADGALMLPSAVSESVQVRVWHRDLPTTVTQSVSDLQLSAEGWTLTLPFTLTEEETDDAPENSLRDRLKSFKRNDG
ncbi:methylamine utilization protein [Reinekea blandensis]|uniref:Methylamine utilization protein n=1 Tax=Reinekea blandensis MED297 TaxID=314283 RepID=A4BB85_9GAMM|nr:methylamine utilization protein [Reinekea blandensis]EAR10698.1 hypothetical protein MED297_11800 [Reinekea sp. MED297] [Reinekea blandensis MED297]